MAYTHSAPAAYDDDIRIRNRPLRVRRGGLLQFSMREDLCMNYEPNTLPLPSPPPGPGPRDLDDLIFWEESWLVSDR